MMPDRLSAWLENLGLGSYREAFEKNAITWDVLPELNQGDLKIKYTASKVNLDPVPASKFDIPKSGYREMTYEESRSLRP